MTSPLVYVALLGMFVTFSVVVGVIVLRFTTVIQQMKRSESLDRSEWMRQVDESHIAAFTNAMQALREVQERVADSQAGMFNRTMDMVHGPQRPETADETLAVDDEKYDARTNWGNDEDEDVLLMRDPTDDDLDFGLANQRNSEPSTVVIRPGETLVPQ